MPSRIRRAEIPIRWTVFSLVSLALLAMPARAQSFLEWKGLARGPFAVSFRTATVVDPTRTLQGPRDYFGRPRPGYGQRPIHVAIWQPADSDTSGVGMTYGDYLPLLAWDTGPELEGAVERQAAELAYIQMVTPLAGPPDSASIDHLLAERVWARRDAKPAPGRFPVLIYAPGSGYPACDNSVLFEYLASHGYVVVSSPSIGPDARRMGGDAFSVEAQTRDLEYLAGYVQTLPQADPERIGTAGFSSGGLASVLFALRNTRVRALISLDGTVREPESLAVGRTLLYFSPERLRVPTLVVTTTPDRALPGLGDESFLEQASYAEITRAVVPGVDHHDFASLSNLLRRSSQRRKAFDWAPATAGYEAVCKVILGFLDVHLKGVAGRLDLGSEADAGCRVTTRGAQKAPPTPADFLEVLDVDGVTRATDMVRTAVKEHPEILPQYEEAITQVGYELLGAGRHDDAVAVLLFGVEISPESFGIAHSLAEVYLMSDDLDRAEEYYLDSKRKLDATTDVAPDIRALYDASRDRGLAAIAKRRQ
jgi:dienelactone hydrolase